jgi:hypothetical protein
MSSSLGFLERVDLRVAWPKEAENFTPWLGSPEGMKLEAEEHAIGYFKACILAQRTNRAMEVVWPKQTSGSAPSWKGSRRNWGRTIGITPSDEPPV